MTLDLTKPVQTRDGRSARVICTDAKFRGDYPGVMSLAVDRDGYEYQVFGTDDLVNVPTKHSGWVNLYPTSADTLVAMTSHAWPSKEAADASQGSWPGRVACVRVEWEEP